MTVKFNKSKSGRKNSNISKPDSLNRNTTTLDIQWSCAVVEKEQFYRWKWAQIAIRGGCGDKSSPLPPSPSWLLTADQGTKKIGDLGGFSGDHGHTYQVDSISGIRVLRESLYRSGILICCQYRNFSARTAPLSFECWVKANSVQGQAENSDSVAIASTYSRVLEILAMTVVQYFVSMSSS